MIKLETQMRVKGLESMGPRNQWVAQFDFVVLPHTVSRACGGDEMQLSEHAHVLTHGYNPKDWIEARALSQPHHLLLNGTEELRGPTCKQAKSYSQLPLISFFHNWRTLSDKMWISAQNER